MSTLKDKLREHFNEYDTEKILAIISEKGLPCYEIEKQVLAKFTVGETYQLWQQAYKKAYGTFPTRNNRPVKGC
jgi:hypothetical protein